jgi:uncharacterized protein DUF2779
MPHYLSKSDFKIARTCPTKLYYKKLAYPSIQDDDEYLQFLADGGYMIETIAKLLHPEGIEIGWHEGLEHSALETLQALQTEKVTLFEATLLSGTKLARVDILRKNGNRFDLIEVKSKSVDGNEARPFFRTIKGELIADWVPYLEDVAYQTLLLRELYPTAVITPFLRLVDTSRTTDIESIFCRFELKRRKTIPSQRFSRPQVSFFGDVERLRQRHFLITVDVSAEVAELMPAIVESAGRFAASLQGHMQKINEPIGVHCLKCEYRNAATAVDSRDGFRECWASLANEDPHILDYCHASSIGGRNTPLINSLVRRGRAKLSDVEENDLVKSDGTVGTIAERQRIQRRYTSLGQEFFSPELCDVLRNATYPLHFIDFETSRLAVPYHAGMHPYEQIAFQWSCHTIPEKGALPSHGEWINLRDVYPNFEFAETLKQQLGDTGTVLIWSKHERTALRDIGEQMVRYGYSNQALEFWINEVAGTESDSSLRLLDLCEVTKKHYFHPKMKGKLSLKAVLPAVWESNPDLHTHPTFSKYFRRDAKGSVADPYLTLPGLPFSDSAGDDDEVVTEGSGAMRAYQEMLYGISSHDEEVKEKWKRLLLQYCELDTAAMVMIWLHWVDRSRGLV